MSTRTFIKLGFTFDYFIPGVLLIIIGGVSYLSSTIAGISILLFGVSLLLLRTGIEIDVSKKRVRKFYDFFSLRFGLWISTTYSPKVELRRTNESQTMQSRGGQMTYETKTYDILFIDKSGFSRELNDFKSYSVAVKTLDLISKELTLEAKNEVEEIRHAALQRRKDNGNRK